MSKCSFLESTPIHQVCEVLHVTTNCEFLQTNFLGSLYDSYWYLFHWASHCSRLLRVLSLSSCSRQATSLHGPTCICSFIIQNSTAFSTFRVCWTNFHRYRSNVPNLPLSLLHFASFCHNKTKHTTCPAYSCCYLPSYTCTVCSDDWVWFLVAFQMSIGSWKK